jgi:starvation-inducible DNA-binding protein
MKVKMEIGIPEKNRKDTAEGLSKIQADTFTLYLKTHHFHWNVTGPMFQTLHLMFETQYNELWLAVDLVAERIRALGQFAPGTYTEFIHLKGIAEDKGIPKDTDMIRELVKGHEFMAKTCREVFAVAEKGDDQSTMDMLTDRMRSHEKTAWMLRSLVEKTGG